jgi:hypothetical protein
MALATTCKFRPDTFLPQPWCAVCRTCVAHPVLTLPLCSRTLLEDFAEAGFIDTVTDIDETTGHDMEPDDYLEFIYVAAAVPGGPLGARDSEIVPGVFF